MPSLMNIGKQKSYLKKFGLLDLKNGVFTLLTSIACVSSALADNLPPDSVADFSLERQRVESMKNSVHIIGPGAQDQTNVDSVKNLLNMFYYDQFRHYQDPRAPYFMFMSRGGSVSMGVGGVVRLRGFYDWNGSIPANGFVPYLIPIPKDPTSMRRLAANAAGTGLFFTIFGRNSKFGNYMAYFQADFSGYGYRDFKIKKAYITAGDWTAGLATSTFEDTGAEPQTIDGSGANGVTSHTAVLIRYMHSFKKKWTVAASVEFPESSTSADGVNTKACSDYLPDVAAFGQFQWAGGESHVRISGLLRTLTYRDLIKDRNYNIMGWATQLSTSIRVLPQLQLYGIASVGQGHESYTTDLSVGNFDLIPDSAEKGRLYAPTAVGYVLGAKYYFKPNIFSNLCLSEQRYYPHKNPGDGQYKYGLYGALNLYWDITSRFEVGMEYLAGKRMNFNGTHGSANRLTALMMLSF